MSRRLHDVDRGGLGRPAAAAGAGGMARGGEPAGGRRAARRGGRA